MNIEQYTTHLVAIENSGINILNVLIKSEYNSRRGRRVGIALKYEILMINLRPGYIRLYRVHTKLVLNMSGHVNYDNKCIQIKKNKTESR